METLVKIAMGIQYKELGLIEESTDGVEFVDSVLDFMACCDDMSESNVDMAEVVFIGEEKTATLKEYTNVIESSFNKQVLVDELSERRISMTIKDTGLKAKKRQAKANVMKKLKKSDVYKQAKDRLQKVIEREARKIARELGISPNKIDLSTIRI